MIIARLISGLGNQLFQYAIGRQLSITNKVPLKLDTSFFKTQSLREYKLNHYNIHADIASEEELAAFLKTHNSNTLAARVYKKLERQLPKYKRRYYKEDTWWVYEPELLKASGKVYLDGYWQHYKYFENLHPQIIGELTLTQAAQSEAGNMISDIRRNSSSVSLHIRRGDYISDTNTFNFMGALPVEYYTRAICYIGQKIREPLYYVFSDDLAWVKDNLKVNAQMQFVDIQGGNKDYLELNMMSTCSHNIIANSSFSWWGAFLNKNPDKIVIGPDKWVVPGDVNARIKILFPSWIKL